MSIIDTFDRDGIEIISPYQTIEKIENFPETVVSVFSQRIADLVLKTMPAEKISSVSGGRIVPIYKIRYKDLDMGFYHTLLGGAASAGLLEEIFAKGAKRVLFFGSCGSLDKNITGGHIIVPVQAYRDEGTSYHYAKASDYIDIKSSEKLSSIFDDLNVPYIKTKTWTTDSFYRETQTNVEKRKKDGCAVVEMECASVMAVGQFRNKDVYEFFYAADCLDNENWDRRILGNMPDDMRERIIKIAFETALRLD